MCSCRPRSARAPLLSLLAALVFLAPGAVAPARAADDPEAAAAAAEVRKAVADGNAKGLMALAAREKPDPWLVAEELIAEGAIDAAIAFGQASDRPGTRGITEYARSRRDQPTQPVLRAAVSAARVAVEARDWKGVVKALADVKAGHASSVDAQVYFARGMGLWGLSKYDDAATNLDDALEVAQGIGWLNLESYVLNWAAVTAVRRKDPRRSMESAIVRVELETKWGRDKELAAALYDLAVGQKATGDARSGRESLKRALVLSRKRKDGTDIAKMLLALTPMCLDLGEITAATTYAREALDLATAGGDPSRVVWALAALGGVLIRSGEVARSLTYLKRATHLARENKLVAALPYALGHLGSAYGELSDFPRALASYAEGLRYRREKKNAYQTALLLNNIAVVYNKMGRSEEARVRLEAARAIFQTQRYAPGLAATSTSLGYLAIQRGDLDEAERLIERALELRIAAWNRPGEASALAALGNVAVQRGKFEDAVVRYERALAIYRGANEHHGTAMLQANLGYAQCRAGSVASGVKLMETAIEEAHDLRDVALLVDLKGMLAQELLQQGENQRALQLAGEAVDHREELLGGWGEEDAAIARRHFRQPAETGALAAARLGDSAKTLRFLEADRAGSLLLALGGRDALQWADLPPELLRAERDARRHHGRAAASLRRAGRLGDRAKQREARGALKLATAEIRAAVSRIQREAKQQAGLYYPRPASLSRIKKTLGSSEALVVYGACAGEALAVVVTKRSARLIMLGKAQPINAACLAYRSMSETADVGAALATLKKAFVAPLKLGGAVKRVILSPSGPLSYVPTSQLFKQTASLIPSATTLVLLRGESTLQGKGVLALGDPSYDATVTTASAVFKRGGVLTRLPETRIEVETIGDVTLVGDKANEAEFKRVLATRSRWRSVHFACHGLVDKENPVLCALALTPTEEDDGFLTVLDIFRQAIPADLAVLSACETGGGAVVSGDGLHGLVRGFMYAGAPRVIASLWKVDDAATRALMLKFYELWNPKSGKGGKSAADALKAAQLHIKRQKKKWEHPYYWAAWVLWGLPE